MKHSAIRNERGSIMVFCLGAVVLGVTFLLVVANVGNIWLKKGAAQDAAEMLAPLLLANQLTYRNMVPQGPTTQELTTTLIGNANANLAQSMGKGTVQYTFGNSTNGTDFTPTTDPNPADPSIPNFNAIAVAVSATPVNLGNLFNLSFTQVQGRAIAMLPRLPDDNGDCLCTEQCTAQGKKGLGLAVCHTLCLVGYTLDTVLGLVDLLLNVNGPNFLQSLQCLFQSLNQIVVVAVTTVLNLVYSVTIAFPAP